MRTEGLKAILSSKIPNHSNKWGEKNIYKINHNSFDKKIVYKKISVIDECLPFYNIRKYSVG